MVIDGDTEHRIKLDANFDEDWGDKAYITTLLYHGVLPGGTKISGREKHEVTISIEEAYDCMADFYLVCVLAHDISQCFL
ncbi:MAG: hypothetical protein K6E53_15030 [Lachnospiraceae bacterium]|nr:hypothetical protein [Lachnospiraceae bacterium]